MSSNSKPDKNTKKATNAADLKPAKNPKGGQSTGAGAGKVTFNPY